VGWRHAASEGRERERGGEGGGVPPDQLMALNRQQPEADGRARCGAAVPCGRLDREWGGGS
jgi:hypothetical protein